MRCETCRPSWRVNIDGETAESTESIVRCRAWTRSSYFRARCPLHVLASPKTSAFCKKHSRWAEPLSIPRDLAEDRSIVERTSWIGRDFMLATIDRSLQSTHPDVADAIMAELSRWLPYDERPVGDDRTAIWPANADPWPEEEAET